MRVLFVCHSSVISGAEGALLDLLAALPESVSPTVACPHGELYEKLRALNIDHVALPEAAGSLRLDTRQVVGALAGIGRSALALRRTVRELSPDVVHANSLRAGLVAIAARTGRHAPTVVHVHDVLPETRVAVWIRRLLARRADAILGVSRYTTERFTEDAGPTRAYTVYNPLDTDRYSPHGQTREQARATAGLGGSPGPLLGVVAQITPWKGHDVAIRALPAVLETHPDARLLIVGSLKFVGPSVRFDNLGYLSELEDLVRVLQLEEHVKFLGEREDIPAIVRSLDLLLCPSWEEPFGRSVIEAMAVGTPVVATNVGGPSEVIRDGTDGILLSPGNAEQWSQAIVSLLDDPERRETYGQRASASVRARFDRRKYAEQMVAIYEDLIDGHLAPPNLSGLSKRRLRVLFVEHGAEMGGAQHSLRELVRALSAEHEVALACPDGPLAAEIRSLGVEVLTVPASQLTFRLRSPVVLLEASRSIRARRAMKDAARGWRPDIVHANTLRAGLLAPTSDAPLVVHCRDLLPPGGVSALVKRTILRRSSAVIAVSRAAATRLTPNRSSRVPVYVVDNPVDTRRFDPDAADPASARALLGITGLPVIAVIAQITPWKGQLRAIRILADLRASHPNAQLLLVGETKFIGRATSYDNQAYELELRATVAELGLESSVKWLGERRDVETVLAATDVLLVPSTEEPFGRTVIEALAMNIPVIATDAGGPGEVIRAGIDGYTVPPDDIEAWTRAISRVLTQSREPSRNYAIERFSTQLHAEHVLSIYQAVLSGAVAGAKKSAH